MRGQKLPLTVKDSIEISQILYPDGDSPALISPDGKKYLVVLERGDVKRNGSWVELISGNTASIDEARKPKTLARLFSKSTAAAGDLIKNVRWLNDSEHVAFLWDDGERPRRVVAIDVRSGQIKTLCEYRTPIVDFDVGQDGQTFIFTAQGQHDQVKEASFEKNGFAVTDQSIWSLLEGNFDGWTPYLDYDTFVRYGSDGRLCKVREPQGTWYIPPNLLRLSPNGRYAITVRPARAVPAEWDRYTDYLFRHDFLPAARQYPDGPNLILRYFVVDTRRRTIWPLWDAPENPSAKILWSRDSQSLIIGPTFLPVRSANSTGLSGQAVAEVDARTGRFVTIPLPPSAPEAEYAPAHLLEGGVLELASAEEQGPSSPKLQFSKVRGAWTEIQAKNLEPVRTPSVRIEVVEDPNTPPALYAAAPGNASRRLILDLDPQLSRFTLGHVELVHWTAMDGRPWTGMFYYPVHYQAGRAYPLVIQTHGYFSTRFSLDGSFTTAFAAQPLANRGIAVLQVGGPDGGSAAFTVTPKEPQVYVAGFEGAIRHFVAAGLVNPEKVGIIGFSRTGWIVEYMLTHSQCPLAAAEVADNMDGSYVQYILSDSPARTELEADLGARPQGEGLEAWMRSAPGFNAFKIHTPLRMEVDSGPAESVLGAWEMFSNLRYLRKPVELFVIPNIQYGVHILQNPMQRLASQGGTVDWFCFWLKDEESSSPAKAAEYERWRRLRTLQK